MPVKAKRKKAAGRPKVSGAKKPLPKTKQIGNKTYTKSSCSRLKSAATKAAKTARAKGKRARVLKNPVGGYCVFTRGAARS